MSGGDRGQVIWPASRSASPSMAATDEYRYAEKRSLHAKPARNSPNNKSVLPDPSFPHTSESSPSGNSNVKSTRMNLRRGVFAADVAELFDPLLSCGQVMVADCSAMGWCSPSRTGTDDTSSPPRYFSIRRRDTRLCSMSLCQQISCFIQ